MKKVCIKLAFIVLVMFAGINFEIQACTNFLITKGASKDGSVMITYAADSHSLYGELYYKPAKDYPENSWFDVTEWDTGKPLGKIKQLRHTYSVVGNMNEYQVAIGETTWGGIKGMVDTNAIIDYGSLIYITLQRAKTAREAIKIFGELTDEYGYYSSGESFSISDANEVWILEMIGKGTIALTDKEKIKYKNDKSLKMPYNKGALWVAIRIPDGFISGHANQARITTFPLNDPENCIYAKDLISFTKSKGLFKGEDKDFSFADIFAPLSYGSLRHCEARVWCGFLRTNPSMIKYEKFIKGEDMTERMPLYIKPERKLSVQDVMSLMRDHYEGTYLDMTKDIGAGPFAVPYRWRPMTWNVDSVQYCHERAVSTQQTGFSFVAQSRSWLAAPIGGIFWFSVDDAYSTVYVPMYCGITKVPESYAEGNGSMINFTWNSAFWVFNFVANYAYSRYSDMIKDIQKVQRELEDKFVVTTQSVDKAAQELYKTNPEQARTYLTDYSVSQGDMTVNRWRKLGEYLLVKYMDGNIKKEKDGHFMTNGYTQSEFPSQPPYPKSWYKEIIKDNGEHLKMHKLKGEKPTH